MRWLSSRPGRCLPAGVGGGEDLLHRHQMVAVHLSSFLPLAPHLPRRYRKALADLLLHLGLEEMTRDLKRVGGE